MSDQIPGPKVNWNSLAEERIRAALAEGQFDGLPGLGQPIGGIDEPYDELWWVRQKLAREQLSALPPALLLRRDVERTLAQLSSMSNEDDVRQEIAALNQRICSASFAASWGPAVDVQPLDPDEVMAQWRDTCEQRA
jgi:hypothetical protein